jgi:hypothetical protein
MALAPFVIADQRWRKLPTTSTAYHRHLLAPARSIVCRRDSLASEPLGEPPIRQRGSWRSARLGTIYKGAKTRFGCWRCVSGPTLAGLTTCAPVDALCGERHDLVAPAG